MKKNLLLTLVVLLLFALAACGGSVDPEAIVNEVSNAAEEVVDSVSEEISGTTEEAAPTEEPMAEEVTSEEESDEADAASSNEPVSSASAGSTDHSLNNLYNVQNQWGGSDAPWNAAGAWVIGARPGQRVVALNAASSDEGQTLVGTMTYEGEGPIGFKATQTQQNTYIVDNQWGGDSAPWNPGGFWLLGDRDAQNIVSIDITSADNGLTFDGTITYAGEGPIGFKAEGVNGGVYAADNQWDAPWHPCGLWVIGFRHNQKIEAVQITSGDDGQTLEGTITYAGEGPINFRGTFQDGNNYLTENSWDGSWNPGGIWVLGCRTDQRLVSMDVSSADGGTTLEGMMTFAGEGPIGIRAILYGGVE